VPWYLSGEGIYNAFDKLIARVIEEFDTVESVE
jgi:hypothetical protein